MKKRILAGALACAMAFSLSTVASADDTETVKDPTNGAYTSSEITGDSELNTLKVEVDVPTTIGVVVNPYKLEVTVDSDKVTDQIIGTPMELESKSNVALAVGIKIGAEKKDPGENKTNNAVIATSSVADGKAKTNSIFSYLEVTGGKEKLAANTAYKAGTKTEASNDYVFPALKPGKKETDPKTGYLEAANVVTLAIPADSSPDGTEKATFTVKGDAVSTPEMVWTADDVLTYSITYNFVPVVTAAAAVTP